MTALRSVHSLLVALMFLAATASPQGIRIAGQADEAVYGNLADAVDVAGDGDTLLFGGGDHPGSQFGPEVTIEGKSLTLVALVPGTATLLADVTVRDLPVGGAVSFVDLTMQSTWPLQVETAKGLVRIEGCRIEGGSYGTGLWIGGDSTVSVSDSEIVGGQAYKDYDDGGLAILVDSSELGLFDCVVTGGEGAEPIYYGAGDGGTGLHATASQLVLSGSTISGGDGGTTDDEGGDGGTGLQVEDCHVVLRDTVLQGGGKGFSILGGGHGSDGVDGVDLVDQDSTLVQDPTAPRNLGTGARVLPALTPYPLEIEALPGDQVFLILALRPTLYGVPPLSGLLLAPLPPVGFLIPLGVAGPAGTLDITPVLPRPPVPLATLTMQLAVVGRSDGPSLWDGASVSVLDPGAPPDCDGDGVNDFVEVLLGAEPDLDHDLLPDGCDPDCNGNGLPDGLDIANGTSSDCNADGIPDECDIPEGSDCNGNGIPDPCELRYFTDQDDNDILDECEPAITVYYDPDAPADGDGSLAAPVDTFVEAMALCAAGDTIAILPGVYTSNAHEFFPHSPQKSLTITAAFGPGTVTFDGQDEDPAFMTWPDSTITFEDLTFVDCGRASLLSPSRAIRAFGSSGTEVTVRNCEFLSCSGAVETTHPSATLRVLGCTVVDSTAPFGGAVHGEGTVEVRDSTFTRCVSDLPPSVLGPKALGGAIYVVSSGEPSVLEDLVFEECDALDDEGSGQGGGVYLQTAGTPIHVRSCIFLDGMADRGGALAIVTRDGAVTVSEARTEGNAALTSGGAVSVLLGGGSVSLGGVTLVDDQALGAGGSISVALDPEAEGMPGSIDLVNAIVWGGTAPSGPSLALDGVDLGLTVAHSLVGGGLAAVVDSGTGTVLTWGPGNLDTDPLLAPDASLLLGSPAIDAGGNGAILSDEADGDDDGDTSEPVPLDLAGNPRRVDDPGAPDAGAGTAPIVDMGALERQP